MTALTQERGSDKLELTVPPSEMKALSNHQNLWNKRIALLMSSGLIAGITPMSTAKRSSQKTLDFAFCQRDGNVLEKQKVD